MQFSMLKASHCMRSLLNSDWRYLTPAWLHADTAGRAQAQALHRPATAPRLGAGHPAAPAQETVTATMTVRLHQAVDLVGRCRTVHLCRIHWESGASSGCRERVCICHHTTWVLHGLKYASVLRKGLKKGPQSGILCMAL